MDVSHPYNAISPSIDTALLVALASSHEARSGRQLAEAIGRSRTGVQHVLNRLVAEGLVEQAAAGSAFLYRFNHHHLLAPAVHEMAGARLELIQRLRELLAGWQRKPVHASLFGSAARGDGNPRSDIDVLIVRPRGLDEDQEDWRGQVDDLADSVLRWTGNHAGIVELPERQLGGLRRRKPSVLRQLDRDAIDLAGTPIRKVLGKD